MEHRIINDGIYNKSKHSLAVSKEYNQKLAFALSRLHDGDYRFAVKEMSSLSENGFANAQYILGRMYNDGIGVLRNTKKAFLLYEQASLKNHTYAQLAIAYMYFYGYYVHKDYNNVVKWSFYASNSGSPIALYNLGLLYYFGIGVETDIPRAIEYFKKSSDLYQKARFTIQNVRSGHVRYPDNLSDEYYCKWCKNEFLAEPLDIIDENFYSIFLEDNKGTNPFLSKYDVIVKMIDTESFNCYRYQMYNDEHRKGLTFLGYPVILISMYITVTVPYIYAFQLFLGFWLILSALAVSCLTKKQAYEEIELTSEYHLDVLFLLDRVWFWILFIHSLLSVIFIIISFLT